MASKTFNEWRSKLQSTGRIDPLYLGMPRNELVTVFGEPDDFSVATVAGKPAILKYADIEFHFLKASEELHLIYSDKGETVRLCISRSL